ncbi:MAG: SIS domain-containing protein [Pirellulales bacterium]
MDAARSLPEFQSVEQLGFARQVLMAESTAIGDLAAGLDERFCRAVRLLCECRGSIIVMGIGKAGHIGQKLAATLASTGTPSHFLHPAEAVHGDLGRLRQGDVAVVLSNSGETEEILRLLPFIRQLGLPLVAITSHPRSSLGRVATVVLETGNKPEACPHGLAPSTSTAAMLALGDALALTTSRWRGFRREDFHRFHPGGSLGRQAWPVEEQMRPLAECRVALDEQTIRQVYVSLGRPGRRSGAIMLIDRTGRLTGVFTDSDLARLLEKTRDEALDQPISQVMTRSPRTILAGALLADAVETIARHQISELPVVNHAGQPLGLIDITDLVQMIPGETPAKSAQPAAQAGTGPQTAAEVVKLSLYHEP